MGIVFENIRFAVRLFVRRPGFSVIAIVALALGIGANTAIFSAVNALFLRPLPYTHSEQLVEVRESHGEAAMPIDYSNFVDWRQQARSFESMAAFQNMSFILTGIERPERIPGANVSGSFFSTLGIRPAMGRDFLPEECRPGAAPVAILSHSLWKGRFAGNPALIGRTLRLNGLSYTVAGVLPAGFRFYEAADIYVPIESAPGPLLHKRGNRDRTFAIARYASGATIDRARLEMDTIARRLEQAYPAANRGVGVRLTPLRERLAGRARTPVMVLLGAVGIVLLIACVNVAGLQLVRCAERRREIAIRAALGAGRARIAGQLLAESILLGIAGGALGLLLAGSSLGALRAFIPADLDLTGFGIDVRVLGFTLVVSFLAGTLFGLLPALHASRTGLIACIKEGAQSSAPGSRRLRNILVASEVALAVVLLAGVGLLIRSFARLLGVDPGFRPANVLTMELNLPETKYTEAAYFAFCRQALDRIGSLPGVEAAGMTTSLPLSGGAQGEVYYAGGQPVPAEGQFPGTLYHAVTPGYFRAMGLRLIRGRFLAASDTPNSPAVVVISETLANRHWRGQEAVGKQLRLNKPDGPYPWMTVVGVVADIRHFGLDRPPDPEAYFSALQLGPWNLPTLVIKTIPGATGLVPAIRAEIAAVDGEQPVHNVRTMDQYLAGSLALRRSNMLLLGIFAVLALVLASVGVYGAVAYSVTQRVHEIGIRVALGALRADVFRLVLGQGMAVVLAGVVAGLAASFALTRVLSSLLYGTSATDPATFAAAGLILTFVALAASYVPARRAAQVDPIVALRWE